MIRTERSVFRATVTQDGTRLLVAEENGPLHVYRFDTLEELPAIAALPEGLLSAAVSPDGTRIALTSHEGIVRVYPSSGQGDPLVLRGHDGSVGHAAFSPDGTELATASVDGTARVGGVVAARPRAPARLDDGVPARGAPGADPRRKPGRGRGPGSRVRAAQRSRFAVAAGRAARAVEGVPSLPPLRGG